MVWDATRVILKNEMGGDRSSSANGYSVLSDDTVDVFGPSAAFCIPVAIFCGIVGAPLYATVGLGAYGAFSAYKVFRSIRTPDKPDEPSPPGTMA